MRGKRIAVLLVSLLILLTLLFIWSNSLRDASASDAQSGSLKAWLASVLDVEQEPFRFLYNNLRKVAHFAEFALLGAEAALWLWLRFGALGCRFFRGLSFCALSACVDEGLQLLSPGRAAAAGDVLLDTGGALFGMLCLWAAVLFLGLLRERRAGRSRR